MAQVPMTPAVFEGQASSAANNAMINNIQDHETRMLVIEAWDAGSRLDDLEDLTGSVSSGNAALDTRVTALEASIGGPVPYCHAVSVANGQVITGTSHASQTWVTIAMETTVVASAGIYFDNALDAIIFPSGTEAIYDVSYSTSFGSIGAQWQALRLQLFNGTTYVTVDDSSIYKYSVVGAFPTCEKSMFVTVPALAGAVSNRLRMQGWALNNTTVQIGGDSGRPLQRPMLQAMYKRPLP